MTDEQVDYFTDAHEDVTKRKLHVLKEFGLALEQRVYSTEPGCWNRTRGIIKIDDTVLVDIKRNYSSFWFTAFEHKDGNVYLVSGADYQGLTIVRLDYVKTGVLEPQPRVDYLPTSANMGFGFCHYEAEYDIDYNELHTEGCIWGGPEEHILYDMTNPMELPWKEVRRWCEDDDD